MCLRAIKTKHYSCSAYLPSVSWAMTLNYILNRLSSFQNLRRKGGKFDHRPERPKVLLYATPPNTFTSSSSVKTDTNLKKWW